MKCPRCQQENPPQGKFCLECATPLALRCTNCGTQLPAGAKFCFECATPVGPPDSAPRFAAPEAYTPKHLAERIINSKAALEGERKQVTVLFADLKSSMELLADRDPEEARKLLDPVLERMMEAVHRYEGTVNQVMGDGVMALFGAPLAHEDHAIRACYAALRMQEAVKRYAEEVHRSAGVPLHIRVGLNSGEVVVRSIGSDLRMDYTAVGQTTHLAARMEQMAKPESILVTADCLRLAEGYVVARPLGLRPVRGLDSRIDVYEVVGAASVRSRFQTIAARGLTRFVGRDSELSQLRQALEQARAGHGQVVAVVGEPGVGKSRLYWEFLHSHRTHGWLVLESGSVSYGKATPYLPVVDLLKTYFRLGQADDSRDIREKVIGKLLALDRALESAVPALLSLLDVAVDEPEWRALDPVRRRQQIIDAVRRLLLRECQVQPIAVVFEDLHWVDSETQAILNALVESLPAARVLLLVNYRPEYHHDWGRKMYYTRLRLDALGPESAVELFRVFVGEDPGLEPLKQVLIAQTGGNPFFLEESVRALVETGALTGEQGAYRLAQPRKAIHVPPTVQAILAARIDRLSADDKRLLQAAAVIGKDVPLSLLRAIADRGEDDLRRGLAELRGAEFLYEAQVFPDLEYTFKHALTHDVAYAGVLHERRRDLHTRIVATIESLHRDRLVEHVERLAHHALRGEQWDRAVRYGRQAAAKALGRSANREATAYVERAMEAVTRLPESQRTRELAVDLRLDLYRSLLPLDELRPLLAHLREAEALALALDDPQRLAWARLHLTHVLLLIDDTRASVGLAGEVVTAAEALGNAALAADAYLWWGCGCYALGEHRRAVELLRKGVEARAGGQHRQPGARDVMAQSGYVAMFLAELGEFVAATTAAEITTGAPDRNTDRPWNRANAYWQIAWFHCLHGDLDRAAVMARRAVELCQQWGFLRTLGTALALQGHVLALAGRVAEAVELVEQGVRQADAFGMTWLQCPRLQFLGEAYLLAGRPTEAMAAAQSALRLARERGEHGFAAWSLRLQAEIATAVDPADVDQTEQRYREALALASELEMRPLVAHCHLGLGRLYGRTGQGEQAREHLTAATSMYREMSMTYWLAKAKAELGDSA